ncbi:hypothetical protein [Lentilactobacillus farraginis]|uniref:Uncharacterized protein n=1 Tax=Lentilactobacillus farraginis DSM 18382 = JCM 14108 TaxID=1423743 RepID=A0A0R1VBL0_9LACO|nr:hypothetical protein [Lentilactobacillus farraginis]KRM02783.1 hypothetical protein FD41_GL001205 [Lentilactobacillus farraginis DSM 18382 = JCM 14108]
MIILIHKEQFHRFKNIGNAVHFLRQATGKPICKWMLEDALKHEQRLFEWQVRRM